MINPTNRRKEQQRIRKWATKNKEQVYDELGRICMDCGTENDLTIHHKKYEVGMEHLEILCNKCHREFHRKELKKRLLMEALKEINKFNKSDSIKDLKNHLQDKIDSIKVDIIPDLKIHGFAK